MNNTEEQLRFNVRWFVNYNIKIIQETLPKFLEKGWSYDAIKICSSLDKIYALRLLLDGTDHEVDPDVLQFIRECSRYFHMKIKYTSDIRGDYEKS